MSEAVRTIDPTEATVSLADAKEHLRVDHDAEDDLIAALVESAAAHVEKWTGLALMPQSWEISFDAFPAGMISLPVGPCTLTSEIVYLDSSGTEQTLVEGTDYRVDMASIEARIAPIDGWPSTADRINAVTVRWSAGNGCPVGLVQAIKLLVGHWYDTRTAVVSGITTAEVPMAVNALVSLHRRFKAA